MRKSLWILAWALLLASCYTSTSKSATYTVTGTATSVTVTLQNLSGSVEHYTGVTLPATYDLGTASPGTELLITAENEGGTGSVTVSIVLGGTTRETATSSAAYASVTCSTWF